MASLLEKKIEYWEHKLLDLGKRNKMLHYKETKRTTIKLISPFFDELWDRIVISEEELTFKCPLDRNSDLRVFSMLSLLEALSQPIPVTKGDIDTDISLIERQKTLKNLRAKSKLALDEQGNNILYMTMGFIEWREDASADGGWIKSPLIMVPVSLILESVNTPYILKRYEDDIVVNPTLAYYWNDKYGITLPLFDADEQTVGEYLADLEALVDKRGWKIIREVSLGLLSFLKINMYRDVQNNKDKLLNNPILKAISGEKAQDINFDIQGFNHDSISPIDTYQVVNADSTQQDAVVMSQKGISFVIQGPPGTGKSQTITNIIATALADGKKVLFVSEKNAALQVVYKRLQDVHLDDFCLPLHSHKANKREILEQIGEALNLPLYAVKGEAIASLHTLNTERQRLNLYANQLHSHIEPLGESIYHIYGLLNSLAESTEIPFSFNGIETITKEKLQAICYVVSEFASALLKMGCHHSENPWSGTIVNSVSHALFEQIQNAFPIVAKQAKSLNNESSLLKRDYSFADLNCFSDIDKVKEILFATIKISGIPFVWLANSETENLLAEARESLDETEIYWKKYSELETCYSPNVFAIKAKSLQEQLSNCYLELGVLIHAQRTVDETEMKSVFIDIGVLYTKLSKIIVAVGKIQNIAGYMQPISYSNLKGYKDLVCLLCEIPQVNSNWFSVNNFDEIINICVETKSLWERYLSIREEIVQVSNQGIFEIDGVKLLDRLKTKNEMAAFISEKMCCALTAETLDRYIERLSKKRQTFAQLWNIISIENDSLVSDRGFIKLTLVSQIKKQVKICEIALNPIFPLGDWSEITAASKPYEMLCVAGKHRESVNTLHNKLLSVCESTVFNLDYNAILSRYKTEYRGVFKWFKSSYRSDRKAVYAVYKGVNNKITDYEIVDLLQSLRTISESEKWLMDNAEALKTVLGNHYDGNATDFISLISNIELFIKNASLFDSKENAVLAMSIEPETELFAVKEYLLHLTELDNFLSSPENADVDMDNYMNNLENVLAEAEDIRSLYGLALKYVNDDNFTYNSIIEIFEKLQQHNRFKETIDTNEKTINTYFPELYQNENTDWDKIYSNVACYVKIKEYYTLLPTDKLERLLLSKESAILFADITSVIIDCDALINAANKAFSTKTDVNTVLTDTAQLAKKSIAIYSVLTDCYKAFLECANTQYSCKELDNHIMSLVYIQNLDEFNIHNTATLKAKYDKYYIGVKTDWNNVIEKLVIANDFKECSLDWGLSADFVKAACENVSALCDFERIMTLFNNTNEIKEQIAFVKSLFDTASNVHEMEFEEAYSKLFGCYQKTDLLEKQIDYHHTRQNCVDHGLGSFVEAVEISNNPINDIPKSFLKGFYKKWLDFAVGQTLPVSEFRERAHNDRIDRFCELDTAQLQIAQLRIREKIIKSYPNKSGFLVGGDELSVLQHELSKKKRHMALRKLFRSIPNLLLKLKPCLMMSPLSVSYFLEAETYKFDMVIFDEASQIFPEDAIGAICRGTQVIIAGDSKQLPPTNFFGAGSGGVYDGIETDDDSDEYEIISDSILEEARNLPNQPLLWHYRSRHEGLIAFSNKEIYKNSLITFPGSMSKTADMGVEYIYVENGAYEGQTNTDEAEQCIKLIAEHINKYPNRSLGIIAFSEKQQSAIEDYVERFRARNQICEWFFDEKKDEPFFVKNLENVQGDERDTIIFSICYAKNRSGQMYMRFGPLGHLGGERRLNVAITRAKFNVKLVGSILPSDIDLNRTNSDGVRLLRSYIEFAMNDVDTSNKPNSQTKQDDDLFSKSIADFLQDKGYRVVRNIGYSDYTIDIGIEKTDLPGCFAAGIECDGDMYVMAKTASDRDRLRTSILKSMGWNLYRVWSTDWIRNPKEAQTNLLAFVDEALKKPVNIQARVTPGHFESVEIASKIATPQTVDLYIDTTNQNITPSISSDTFVLDEYIAANWWDVTYPLNPSNRQKIEALITYVVGIEQPIHRNLLYQRLAGAFGNQKATSAIRKAVDPFLGNMQKQTLIKQDDFFALSSNNKTPMRKAGTRSIEHISVLEIAAVMLMVIKNAYGLSKESLATEAARLFGFERKGPKIAAAMGEAINYLKTKGIIRIVDDKIQIVEG